MRCFGPSQEAAKKLNVSEQVRNAGHSLVAVPRLEGFQYWHQMWSWNILTRVCSGLVPVTARTLGRHNYSSGCNHGLAGYLGQLVHRTQTEWDGGRADICSAGEVSTPASDVELEHSDQSVLRPGTSHRQKIRRKQDNDLCVRAVPVMLYSAGLTVLVSRSMTCTIMYNHGWVSPGNLSLKTNMWCVCQIKKVIVILF